MNNCLFLAGSLLRDAKPGFSEETAQKYTMVLQCKISLMSGQSKMRLKEHLFSFTQQTTAQLSNTILSTVLPGTQSAV